MDKSSVFEETYTNYLAQIGKMDFEKIADRLGAETLGDELIIPVFGKPMRISSDGISESSGSRPNFSVCVILFKYLLLCPDHDPVEMSGSALRISRIRHLFPAPSSITPKPRWQNIFLVA